MTTNYVPEKAPQGMFPKNEYFSGWIEKFSSFVRNGAFVRTVTSADQFKNTDWLIRVDCTSAGVTVTLPPAVNAQGKTCIMKKIDSSGNTATLAPNGSEKIDGASTKTTSTQYVVIRVVSNGTGWDVI